MNNKILKRVIGIFLPVISICLLIPQTVQASSVSAVNNGDLSITVSVGFGGYDGYVVHYLDETQYNAILPELDAEIDGSGHLPRSYEYSVMNMSNTLAGEYMDLSYSVGASFQEGDTVYVLVFFAKWEEDIDEEDGPTGDYYYYIWDWDSAAITIGADPQTAAVTNYPHTHSYQWAAVTEASLTQDGVEQYACSCGDVQLAQPIPAATVYIKGLYDAVKSAPKNGSVSYNSQRWTGISDYVIKKLAERTDVTTMITFEYKGASYTFTIPAGTSYEFLLNDKENYYGFFTFCELLGIPVAQL